MIILFCISCERGRLDSIEATFTLIFLAGIAQGKCNKLTQGPESSPAISPDRADMRSEMLLHKLLRELLRWIGMTYLSHLELFGL